MALALDELTSSFSSSSFAVVTDSEKDLRASLATCLPLHSASTQPWAVGAPSRGFIPPSTVDSGYHATMGVAGGARPPPPNTPMGTPVKDNMMTSYFANPMSNAPLYNHGLFRSPPPSPNRASFQTTDDTSRCIVAVDFTAHCGTCPACAYSLNLGPIAPRHLFPNPSQHSCPLSCTFDPHTSLTQLPLRLPIQQRTFSMPETTTCSPTTYLPSPSPSPIPAASASWNGSESQGYEPIGYRTRQRSQQGMQSRPHVGF